MQARSVVRSWFNINPFGLDPVDVEINPGPQFNAYNNSKSQILETQMRNGVCLQHTSGK
jgi:hypothetical protein